MALQEDLKEDRVKIKILVNCTHFYFHNFLYLFSKCKDAYSAIRAHATFDPHFLADILAVCLIRNTLYKLYVVYD